MDKNFQMLVSKSSKLQKSIKHKINSLIGDLLRDFGVTFVLGEIISLLRDNNNENEHLLARDIERALQEYERRKK